MVKNLPAMWEIWVQPLAGEDPIEREMASHSSIPAWRIPWAEEPGRLYSPWGLKESDTTNQLNIIIFFNAKIGGGVVSCCRLLGVGILCSCSCPHKSGHTVPVNLWQDKYYFLFCNLSLYEWKCHIFEDQSLENGLSCIFQAVYNISNL